MSDAPSEKPKRRPRYSGTHPRHFHEKYKEHNPERYAADVAKVLASGDVDKTVSALKDLGGKAGLSFGNASKAADQNAFAVTTAFADKNGVKSLTDYASKCSGKDTVLGGPAECPQRPFCQPGLEKTYSIQFGKFVSLDAGGPQSLDALKKGTATIALVFSSDGSLA